MIIFALISMALMSAVGAGIDLARAYNSRQKLSEVATLACQYASRPSVVQKSTASDTDDGAGTAYQSSVTSYITQTLQGQNFKYTQTNTTPFSYTQGGAANVSLTASVPTTFMKLAHVTQLSIAARSHCYDSAANIPQRVPNGNSKNVVQEGFEVSACTGTCWTDYVPGQSPGTFRFTPTTTIQGSATYTGSTGTQWYAVGYCLEIDSAGVILSSVPEGTHSAELNCDNGSGTAGRSSISTKSYLAAGTYELRWNYASRVDYVDYDPVYICGNKATDVSWATDTNSSGGPTPNALKNNQINVYLDLNTSGAPPMHTTLDGTQQLAGSNLIDVCVYSTSWIERSVHISVTTPGFYWLSFAADGQNNSYGGQIDNIRLCNVSCSGSVQDNYPTAWLPTSGVNQVLFEDTFESPSYSNSSNINTAGNAGLSNGTSGSTSSGWSAPASGWVASPVNQVDYVFYNTSQGSQSVQLDGTSSGSTSNRSLARSFLLVPGYYQVSYLYRSNAIFSALTSTYCGATPSAASISSLSGSAKATVFGTKTSSSVPYDTNIVGVFMSNAQLVSYPNASSVYGSSTTYTNPDGTTSSTPTVAPNSISLTSYNSAQSNPLLDICGYSSSWQTRTANILIQKPAYYWLTLAALGTADTYGGSIDDVKITALGSPYMASPPSNPVTIPVPDPQPGATLSFTGFSITTDPLAP